MQLYGPALRVDLENLAEPGKENKGTVEGDVADRRCDPLYRGLT